MPHQIFRTHPSPSVPNPRAYTHLDPSQVATWMQYGFLKVPNAFSRSAADAKTRSLWTRLNMSPNDPATWNPITYLPGRESMRISEFAPKAWNAICELCGGKDRVAGDSDRWDDGFIVNLGDGRDEVVRQGKPTNVVDEVNGWHVDGNWFVHFLDSPEQAVLVVVCWGDVIEGAGGTVVAADSVGRVAKWLYDHPAGVDPALKPYGQPPSAKERWHSDEWAKQCDTFFELTGEAGDVFLLHPFMIHSAAKNGLRIPRIITNPCIQLKEPFKFDRKDQAQYSLVELKTLKELGSDRLSGWKIKGQRRYLDPAGGK